MKLILLLTGLVAAQTEWTIRYTSGSNTSPRSIVWTGSQLVAVGDYGTILTSPDGSTWTKRTSENGEWLRFVTWADSQLVAVGGSTILTSPDGIDWAVRRTSQTPGITPGSLSSVTWTDSLLVAVGSVSGVVDSGLILTSPDGITWTERVFGVTFSSITWTGESLIAAAGSGIYTSLNGVTWTQRESSTWTRINSIIWTGSQVVAVGADTGGTPRNGLILTSPDGIIWTRAHSGTIDPFHSVTWTDKQLVASKEGGTIRGDRITTSSDGGITWIEKKMKFTNPDNSLIAQDDNHWGFLGSIIWTGEKFVAASTNGIITSEEDEIVSIVKKRLLTFRPATSFSHYFDINGKLRDVRGRLLK